MGNINIGVFYLFSAALSYQDRPLKYTSLVTEEYFTHLPNRERVNLRKFLVLDALKTNQFLTAINFLEDSNGNLIQGYEEWIGRIIGKIEDIEDIDDIFERHKDEYIQIFLYSRKLQLMIRNGDLHKLRMFSIIY